MTARDFCHWLQGFFEIGGDRYEEISPDRAQLIRRRLEAVAVDDGGPAYAPRATCGGSGLDADARAEAAAPPADGPLDFEVVDDYPREPATLGLSLAGDGPDLWATLIDRDSSVPARFTLEKARAIRDALGRLVAAMEAAK
jgi:hypothetical protein